MTWKTHIIGGAEVGLLAANMHNGTIADTAIIVGTAMLGSVLPDIDHQKSKLAQSDAIVGLASAAICRFTKHRGFTHTTLGALVFAISTYILMMFNTAQQALIALASAFSGFMLLQLFGSLRRYSVLLALAAYMAAPRIADSIRGLAHPIRFSPDTARLAAMGVFLGCLMHMLYDAFTKRGAPIFWPLRKKAVSLMPVRTRGTSEGFFAAIMLTILAFTIVYFYRDVNALELIKDFIREAFGFALRR